MQRISHISLTKLGGGFGTYPGYNYDDHARGSMMFIGTVAGIVQGLWNELYELSK